MPEVIPTNNTPTIDLGAVRVWTSPSLSPPEWTEQPYLYCDVLDLHAAPQIDQAQFSFRYGRGIQLGESTVGTYQQLDVIGHFVKVELVDVDDGLVRRWFGVIEAEINQVWGASEADEGVSSGTQRFQAFGLLRLLDRVFFRSATKFRDATETEPITIARGIPFNMSEEGDYQEIGNRSTATSDGGFYLFADAPQLASEWTAFEAAEYLLGNIDHIPVDGHDVPLANWRIEGDPAILDWYIVHTRTEGRTSKDILDELIPRKRAVGYWVDYDEDENTVVVHLFSLNGSDLLLPTGTIPANPDQRELDFEYAVSIERCTLRNVVTTTYNEVIARGERRTSTVTLRFDPQYAEMDKGWSDDQETSYLDGASNSSGYSALSLLEKYQQNALRRSGDDYSTVFCRFQLSADWNQRAATLFQNNDPREWHVVPLFDSEGEVQPEYDAGTTPDGEPIWPQTLLFCPKLALLQARDYQLDRIASGDFNTVDEGLQALDSTQYLRPLFFWYNSDLSQYEPLERLGSGSAFENKIRHWSIQPTILGRGPVVDLVVNGGPPQFIAADFWGTAAATDPEHDPDKNGGINYDEFYATLTIDTGVPIEHVETIDETRTGVQKRTLYIDVPDARVDYVVPYTVVGLVGIEVIQTTSGGIIRDDRDRLAAIAQSAAEWYGTLRQTLEVSFRKISPVVEIGSLIVSIPSNYQREEVNTVVTRLTYHLGTDPRRAYTEFETSFAEFELL